jgi:hypothetical protein
VEFDEAVDGLGAAVAGAVGVEVAEKLAAPLLQGPPEAGDFGDGAAGERGQDLLGDLPAGGVAVLVVAGTDLLGAPPGELDLEVLLPGRERGFEPGLLPFGQVLLASAQDVPDPIERVATAALLSTGGRWCLAAPAGARRRRPG